MIESRAQQLRRKLASQSLDGFVVTSPTNIRYLTGFTGSNGSVAVTRGATTLVTDARYTQWAAEQVGEHDSDIEVVISAGRGRAGIQDALSDCEKIGLESDHISWSDATALVETFSAQDVVATSGIVEALRQIKSKDEIESLRAAAGIADVALGRLLADLKPGVSEIEVARRLEYHLYDSGRALASFDIIVASGPNSARPHHEPSDRELCPGDLVIIDSGAVVDGYCSDMTRSFILGEPSEQQREILDVVAVAQRAGVAAVAPGVAACEVDAVCRGVIEEAGFGEYFVHGTGHGVGLEIHEAPSVSSTSTATLCAGHTITVEPGVYIPDVGGVRWEDTVLVTSTGAETLTNSPKQPVIEL